MGRHAPGRRTTSQSGGSFHPTFHFLRDTRGRHATPRDTMWLMLLDFPNGVGSQVSNLLRPRGLLVFLTQSDI